MSTLSSPRTKSAGPTKTGRVAKNNANPRQKTAYTETGRQTRKSRKDVILREEEAARVYENVFETLVTPKPYHPWDPHPQHSRFKTLIDLLRASRQVYKEARSLFRDDYSHRVVLYFTDSRKLKQLLATLVESAEQHLLGCARFSVRQEEGLSKYAGPSERAIGDSNHKMWMDQPGFEQSWRFMPGFYYVDSWNFLAGELGKGNQFQHGHGDHHECRETSDCLSYSFLLWPRFGNQTQLTSYMVEMPPGHPATPPVGFGAGRKKTSDGWVVLNRMVNYAVFEGRLADLYSGMEVSSGDSEGETADSSN